MGASQHFSVPSPPSLKLRAPSSATSPNSANPTPTWLSTRCASVSSLSSTPSSLITTRRLCHPVLRLQRWKRLVRFPVLRVSLRHVRVLLPLHRQGRYLQVLQLQHLRS